ncbi:MAG: putative transcriptional regulator [Methanolobus sp. T82-4]|jgi:predicted transcriptional regulator|nr:MAG: putative transcriptional regulator [Methanolobus sp. T82-4]
MKRELLDVVFASEKRKNFLLLLKDGPQEMEDILESLDTTRQNLLPQVKILEENYLVRHYDDSYELSMIGSMLVDEMVPLLETIDVFDSNIDYWGTRKLDFIPSHLLDKLDQLNICEIISPPITELYSFYKSFNPNFEVSSRACTITAFLYPKAYELFTDMFEHNMTLDFIVTRELLAKIRKEHWEEFSELIENDNFNMYVYNEKMDLLFLVFDEVHLLMAMLKNTGEFDHKFIACKSKSAIHWGQELFEYYQEQSTPVTEI